MATYKRFAKIFSASVMAFVEIIICEGCRNLLFGGGKTQGILAIERPKFCPHCGAEIDIQLKALSEEEIMSYADAGAPEAQLKIPI